MMAALNRFTDWLCFQFVMLFPVERLDPHGRVYGGFILPRAGNHVYRHDHRVKEGQ